MLRIFSIVISGIFFLHSQNIHAQEYPYDEAPPSGEDNSLPVESPEELVKQGRLKKRTSLFRMGLKAGVNHSYFQSLVVEGVSITGFGAEGRLSFGWDMAFQPIFLETEVGYRGMNLTTEDKLNVFVLQQGVFYRSRLGKTSMWKPGLLTTLDLRIESTAAGESEITLFPSVGFTSLWDLNAFLIQATFYIHRLGSTGSFVSSALLAGIRF